MGNPQLSYTTNNKAGVPGMLYDNADSNFVSSKPCGATPIQAGQMVELVGGVLRPAQGTGDPNSVVAYGVAMISTSGEPNPTANAGQYTQGMDIPVLRQGRIWALCAPVATFAQGQAVNYTHSSTGANTQGYFTSGAASATVGAEVSATKAVWYQDGGMIGASPSCAAIELNLP